MHYTIIFLVTLLCYSCASTPHNDNRQEQHQAVADTVDTIVTAHTPLEDTLSYRYEEVKTTSPYLSGDEERLDTSFYRIRYPHFALPRVNRLVHSAIFIEGETNPQQAAEAFIDAYNEFVEDDATHHISAAWIKDMESRVVLNTPALLSMCTQFYEYTGGAHGHSVAIWSNFDLSEMRKIALTDLIDETSLPKLTALAERKFRASEELEPNSPLDKDYFFVDGIFALNDNFGLTEKELIFFYNEYEIKPYAQGSTTIRIAYEELTDMLRPRGREYVESIRNK